jgi:fumarylacetoacetase
MDKFIIPADAKTWVLTDSDTHFPIQNLPMVTGEDEDGESFIGVAIGNYILNMSGCSDAKLWPRSVPPVDFDDPEVIDAPSPSTIRLLRRAAFELLRADAPELRDNAAKRDRLLLATAGVTLHSPSVLGAFVDFYSGIHHASNVGKMFRPDQPPLLPNYRWIPIGYNGRSSSILMSGSDIIRPKGQMKPADGDPVYGPTKELDFELEMGFFAGVMTDVGQTMTVAEAEESISGLVIVNDWSARDFQRWEYQPLGPFLAKSFATSISFYLVSLDALEPFRIEGMPQEPAPLPHLARPGHQHFDIELQVTLQTEKMSKPQVICRSNTKHLYWSFAQQLAHQCSNGTPIEPGDLYASGTISGPDPGEYGSMLELTWRGSQPITMDETGETRTFLEDGDTLTMSAWAQGDGYRIGFGEVTGQVIEAEG